MGKEKAVKEWSGSCAPEAPGDWWVDDETGEYVNAVTADRMSRAEALKIINKDKRKRDGL